MKQVFSILLTLALLVGSAMGQTTAEKFKALLPDMASTDLNKQKAAQEGWQAICMEAGAPGKAAELAEVNKLMAAELLKKETPLDTRWWLLEQLQWTGDASVVPAVAAQLDDKDNRVRDRAARALAHNPSKEAEAALKKALTSTGGVRNQTIAEALAERNPDLSVGVETEPPQSLPYATQAAFDGWMKGYAEYSPDDKARALAAVKVRKDKKYLKLALSELKNENEFIRNNALFALEKIGGTAEVPVLLEMLGTAENPQFVQWTMQGIAADGFDDALLKALNAEKDFGRYTRIARVLVNRNVKPVLQSLLAKAVAKETNDRVALLDLAKDLASKDEVDAFVDAALMYQPSRELDRAAGIVAQLTPGDAEPVVKKMTPQNAVVALSIIGRIGGPKALETVKKEMAGSNKEAAIRALCNWPNAVVADDLLALVGGNESDQNKIAALRAFIRVMTLRNEEIGIRISDKDRIVQLRKAMEVATRLDEKRLILDRLNSIRCLESAQFAAEYLDNADLKENACRAVVELAHHNNLRQPNKSFFVPALNKVLEISGNAGLKDRAKRYLAQ